MRVEMTSRALIGIRTLGVDLLRLRMVSVWTAFLLTYGDARATNAVRRERDFPRIRCTVKNRLRLPQ